MSHGSLFEFKDVSLSNGEVVKCRELSRAAQERFAEEDWNGVVALSVFKLDGAPYFKDAADAAEIPSAVFQTLLSAICDVTAKQDDGDDAKKD